MFSRSKQNKDRRRKESVQLFLGSEQIQKIIMPPIDGRLVKAKRFPVHAAATVCAMGELQRLLTEDAAFHVGRKIPDLELSVLHSACSSRHGSPNEIFGQIVKLLIEVSFN